MSIGAAVVELLAGCVLPTLVTELSTYTLRSAAREMVRGALDAHAGRRPSTVPLHAVSDTTIVSYMPGRVRLKVAGLRGHEERACALSGTLRAVPGVRRASGSARTGNLLVEFDPRMTSVTTIRAALEPRRRRRQQAARTIPARTPYARLAE